MREIGTCLLLCVATYIWCLTQLCGPKPFNMAVCPSSVLLLAVGLTLRSLFGWAQSVNEQCTCGVLHDGPLLMLTAHKCWALLGRRLLSVLLEDDARLAGVLLLAYKTLLRLLAKFL